MKLSLKRSAFLLVGSFFVHIAQAEALIWESIGRRNDYQISWAKNLQEPSGSRILTMIKLKYDKADQAPNNARFDNVRIGVEVSCQHKTYAFLGQTYNMGNRQVLSQKIDDSSFEPYDGTYVEAVARKLCPR